MNTKEFETKAKEFVGKGILAGILISFGGFAYLAVGGIVGAIMFAFGLMSVVYFGALLYTGTAGFRFEKKWLKLPLILIMNVLGCYIMGLFANLCGNEAIIFSAQKCINTRIEAGYIACVVRGLLCGAIMTTVVKFGSEGKILPLLFGIPLFILCGFYHSIADAFYVSTAGLSYVSNPEVIYSWLFVVLGNFIGCNMYEILGFGKQFVKTI